jgi:hypothetical protein
MMSSYFQNTGNIGQLPTLVKWSDHSRLLYCCTTERRLYAISGLTLLKRRQDESKLISGRAFASERILKT